MKDWAKFVIQSVVVFGAIYLVWNIFWRSFFVLNNIFGFLVAFALVAVLVGAIGRWLDRPQHGRNGAGTPTRAAAAPLDAPAIRPSIERRSPVNPPRSEAEPAPSHLQEDRAFMLLPSQVDYLVLVSQANALEDRCKAVWDAGLRERHQSRDARRHDEDAVREFIHTDRESRRLDSMLVADIDTFLDALCDLYWSRDEAKRKEIRSLLEDHPRLAGNIHNYVGRSGLKLGLTRDAQHLLRGLVAASMDDNHGLRVPGYEWGLGRLYVVAWSASINPSPYFQIAAAMSSTEPNGIRAMLEDFEKTEYFIRHVQPDLVKHNVGRAGAS